MRLCDQSRKPTGRIANYSGQKEGRDENVPFPFIERDLIFLMGRFLVCFTYRTSAPLFYLLWT